MLSNCGDGVDSWESLGLQGDQTSPSFKKKSQPWIFIGRTDPEAEAPILWSPDAKSWLIGEDLDGGKDWGQEEKQMAEEEMVGWHHCLNGQEFEQTLGDGEGQGSLVCCSLGVSKSRAWFSDWIATAMCSSKPPSVKWRILGPNFSHLKRLTGWDFKVPSSLEHLRTAGKLRCRANRGKKDLKLPFPHRSPCAFLQNSPSGCPDWGGLLSIVYWGFEFWLINSQLTMPPSLCPVVLRENCKVPQGTR